VGSSLKSLAPRDLAVVAAVAALLVSAAVAAPAAAQPVFSKLFSPDTIGVGSTSELIFTIDNSDGGVADDLAFTDVLPAGVVLATPAAPTSDCVDAMVTAADGGDTVTLADGGVPANSTCTVSVFVTAAAPGVYMNVSGDLSSSAGSSGTASDTLTVTVARPGITKSFSPATIPVDGFSLLTVTLDNSGNESNATGVEFTDFLPPGVTIASPLNASTDCSGIFAPVAGATEFSLFNGTLPGGDVCQISVEVTATLPGTAINRTSDLTSSAGDSGFAVAALEVEPPGFLIKRFTDDPAVPGGLVTLEFTLTNFDRSNAASGVTFTDDLDATLSGLTAVTLPVNPCGAGSSLTGTNLLTFANGSLGPGASCTFSATLQVPGGATGGAYTNTTSVVEVTYEGAGEPTFEDPASDRLVVTEAPVLGKEFVGDPVPAGGSLILRFTITNDTASPATSIGFTDDLSAALPGVVITPPANGFCGAGSTIAVVPPFTGAPPTLVIVGGAQVPAMDFCTFDLGLDVPLGITSGDYLNVTSVLTATVDGEVFEGPPASDTVTVIAAPQLTKSFAAAALPGGTVDLEFTLAYDENAQATATGIGFSDDLTAVLAGLTAVGTPIAGCGGTLSGTTMLTFSGGSLAPDSTCSFSVPLQVPAAAPPGVFSNTTSDVAATVLATPVASAPATADLLVAALTLSKQFLDDPVLPGGLTTLRFTVINNSASGSATGIFFTDSLTSALSGLAATNTPLSPICNTGTISGATSLTFSGGSLGPSESCFFDVVLQVPIGAVPGQYHNVTSTLQASFEGSPVVLPPASDAFEVIDPLSLTKQFIDDPVGPGATATLRFTLFNQAPATAVTAVAFTDDLDASLPGLAAVGLPMAGCGGTISGTTDLTFTGGTVAAASSCFFDVAVQVPAAAAFGSYPNSTSAVTGTADGLAVSGPPASDRLTVSIGPAIAKTFLTSPVPVGGTTSLQFTVTNTSPTLAATAVAFSDDLDAFLPGVTATPPAAGSCGAGSTFAISPIQTLTMTGGTLAAGASCVFTVDLQLPAGGAAGTFTNTTAAVTATLSGMSLAGNAATADLLVVAPPVLTKTFLDNPVADGGTSALQFTVDNPNPGEALSSIAFSDDLDAALSGLASVSPVQMDVCGAGSQLSGGSLVTFSGGSLAAGASCTFSVTVQVPGGQPLGTVASNVTAAPTAAGGGLALTGQPAADELRVSSFTFEKAFSGSVLPGGTVSLGFTLTNVDLVNPASGLGFSDDLDAVLPGLMAIDTPQMDVCGAGSTLTGTSVLTFAGGQLAAGASCTFSVTVEVPADAVFGTYVNTTSQLAAGGVPVADPAAAELEVERAFIIPTLDGWGLLLLALLFAAAAWWRLRRSRSLQP